MGKHRRRRGPPQNRWIPEDPNRPGSPGIKPPQRPGPPGQFLSRPAAPAPAPAPAIAEPQRTGLPEPDPWQAVPGSVQPMRSFFDVGARQTDGIITYTDMEGNVIGPPGQPGDPVTVGGPISQVGAAAPAAAPGQTAQPPVQESLWGTDFDQFQQQWFDKIMAPAQNALAARGMGAAAGSEFQHATARAGAESALIAWQARMDERKMALMERSQRQGEKISRQQLNLQREQLRQSYRMFIKELDYNSYWQYVGVAVSLASNMAPDVRDWGSPQGAAQAAVGGAQQRAQVPQQRPTRRVIGEEERAARVAEWERGKLWGQIGQPLSSEDRRMWDELRPEHRTLSEWRTMYEKELGLGRK